MRPLVDGVGDVTRIGGSRLEDRIRDLSGIAGTLLDGRLGMGGARLRTLGDGERKVRSVIEELLPRRCRFGRMLPAALPNDDVEPLRAMRFVCSSPIGTGDEACDRKAAAAAA